MTSFGLKDLAKKQISDHALNRMDSVSWSISTSFCYGGRVLLRTTAIDEGFAKIISWPNNILERKTFAEVSTEFLNYSKEPLSKQSQGG